MKELRTEIEMNAPTAVVWQTLMDFDAFHQWNPFIQSIKGEAVEGQQLTVNLIPPGGQSMTFHPRVMQVNSGQTFRWLGHLGLPGLFDGEHIFELESLPDNRSKFIHRECFSGILVPLLWKMLDGQTRQGFEQMNQALKQHVENLIESDPFGSSASDIK